MRQKYRANAGSAAEAGPNRFFLTGFGLPVLVPSGLFWLIP
jgi:hypothetical protein